MDTIIWGKGPPIYKTYHKIVTSNISSSRMDLSHNTNQYILKLRPRLFQHLLPKELTKKMVLPQDQFLFYKIRFCTVPTRRLRRVSISYEIGRWSRVVLIWPCTLQNKTLICCLQTTVLCRQLETFPLSSRRIFRSNMVINLKKNVLTAIQSPY